MSRTPKRKPVSASRQEQAAETLAFTLRLPPELAIEIAAIAAAEGRSRAKQIEMFLRQSVQSYQRRSAA